jgi:flagellar hook-associated protein 1 FlgK
MSARSLQAQQFGLNVTGQNISNVNTPGYTRRVVDFADVPPSAGGGVEVQGVRAIRDSLLERRLLQQVPLGAYDAAVADALTVIEASLGATGAAIDGGLDRLFSSFAELAENPTSSSARQNVLAAADALATSFNEIATRLELSRRDADARLRGAVDEINTLTGRIAQINGAMPAATANGTGLTLRDEQAQLVRRLSELAHINVIARDDGGVDVTIGSGRPLVVAANSYQIGTSATAPFGYATLTAGDFNITSEVTGGTVGGLLHVRDTAVPGYQAALDALAAQTATSVNTLHAAGFDLDGNGGGAFFSYTTAITPPADAAKNLRLDPALSGDARRIAAASVAISGDNGTARALAALRNERVFAGGTATLNDGWGDLVSRIGSDAQAAAMARDTHDSITREVDALRDQVSGVSLDEEALNMLKFQRAYEANAKFFTVVDSLLDTLMNTYRP